jgi:hypothetical protein
MNLKKYAPILAVFLIIIAAGCTSSSSGTITTNDGVVINSFEADDYTIHSGETTNIYLEVQNDGGVDATNVKAYLFGVNGWKGDSSPKSLGNLEAPKENIPSSPRTVMWSLTAPEIPEGVENPFTITSRVVYHYKSDASGSINVYSDEEWRRKNAQQPITPSTTIPVKNSPGPIHVSITGPSDVKESYYTNGIPLLIKISNTGSGYPIKGVDDWDRPSLSGNIIVLGGRIKCYSDDGVLVGGNNGAPSIQLNDMDMRYKKPKSISCSLIPELGNNPFETITVSFSFDYNYYVQKSIIINVIGKK